MSDEQRDSLIRESILHVLRTTKRRIGGGQWGVLRGARKVWVLKNGPCFCPMGAVAYIRQPAPPAPTTPEEWVLDSLGSPLRLVRALAALLEVEADWVTDFTATFDGSNREAVSRPGGQAALRCQAWLRAEGMLP